MTLRNRFTRRMFRRRSPRRSTKWGAITIETNVTAAQAVAEVPIIVSTDYADNLSLSPSGVTMVRMVGHLTFTPQGITTTFRSLLVAMGIAHIDADETAAGSFDPGVAQNLIDERWLWLDSYGQINAFTAGGSFTQTSQTKYFDIRQRVRLRDSGVSLFLADFGASTANASVVVNGMIRYLLAGDAT